MKKILLIGLLMLVVGCGNESIDNEIFATHCLSDKFNWTQEDMQDFAKEVIEDMRIMIPKYTYIASIEGNCVTVRGY